MNEIDVFLEKLYRKMIPHRIISDFKVTHLRCKEREYWRGMFDMYQIWDKEIKNLISVRSKKDE